MFRGVRVSKAETDQPQLRKLIAALQLRDMVITPADDRLSRDTTDFLVVARDTQKAEAGIKSLAEPFLDTASGFAEIIFAMLRLQRSSSAAAFSSRRRAGERRPGNAA